MPLTGIYAITDDELLPPLQLCAAVESALAGGIALLQYRSKQDYSATRLRTVRELQTLCAHYGVPLLINDDVELCASVGAAGVHIGRQDAPLAQARKRLGADAIIGVTCHASLADAIVAEQHGADYVAFGRFFPSHTKPTAPPADLALLTHARAALRLPIVAIGGINTENGAAVIQAGADMLACVHSVFGGPDVSAQTRALVALFSHSGKASTNERTTSK